MPGPFTEGVRMGRKRAADPRDRDYAARDVTELQLVGPHDNPRSVGLSDPLPTWASDLPHHYRHHKRSRLFPLDQDGWSACVGYAFGELVLAGPIMNHIEQEILPKGFASIDDFLRRGWYLRAQDLDEWDGREPDYYGTSMRAGAKVGQELGFWPNYFWLNTVPEMARFIILHGPAAIGVDMFSGMFATDAKGYLSVTGAWEGGHAMIADEVNIKDAYFGGPQSWGRSAYTRWRITFKDFEYLLSIGGEALAIPEVRIPKTK